jgi:Ran-binding protein 3
MSRDKLTRQPPLNSTSAGPAATSADATLSAVPAPAPVVKKPQATFGAFSSTSSPFAKSSAASGSRSAFGSASTSTGASAKPFSSSGFGGFSGSSSPFSSKKTSAFGSAAAASSTGAAAAENSKKNGDKADKADREDVDGKSKDGDEADGEETKGKKADFGDILSGVGDEDEEAKDRPQMTEKDGELLLRASFFDKELIVQWLQGKKTNTPNSKCGPSST